MHFRLDLSKDVSNKGAIKVYYSFSFWLHTEHVWTNTEHSLTLPAVAARKETKLTQIHNYVKKAFLTDKGNLGVYRYHKDTVRTLLDP